MNLTVEDPGDVDQEPFTPGWVPDGWEKGEPILKENGFTHFVIKNWKGGRQQFCNWRLPAFYKWLEWWNDE